MEEITHESQVPGVRESYNGVVISAPPGWATNVSRLKPPLSSGVWSSVYFLSARAGWPVIPVSAALWAFMCVPAYCVYPETSHPGCVLCWNAFPPNLYQPDSFSAFELA